MLDYLTPPVPWVYALNSSRFGVNGSLSVGATSEGDEHVAKAACRYQLCGAVRLVDQRVLVAVRAATKQSTL